MSVEYEEIHDRLVNRSNEIHRRREHLEQQIERERRTGAARGQLSPLHSTLEELLEAHQQGSTDVERALERIAAGSYGGCSSCGKTIPLEVLELLPMETRCVECSGRLRHSLELTREQHIRFERLIDSVQHQLGPLTSGGSGGDEEKGGRAAVLGLLVDLERELPHHFAGEELGGYLAPALSAAPRFAKKARKLEREHAEFCQRMAAIVSNAIAAAESVRQWQRVASAFRDFSAALIAHEQSENEIMSRSLLNDIGGNG